jgi:hypothetical protein
MARLIASKVRAKPDLMQLALRNLDRWRERNGGEPRAYREWRTILETKAMEDILDLLVEDSEEGRRRRQSSPFTGILTPNERKALFEKYEAITT